jgi:hypothetical protein
VLEVLAELMLARGTPSHIRSDNGPEFAAVAVKEWLGNLGVNTAFIEPGSPWENGYVESFNSKLRDELPDGEIFYSLKEAQILIEGWRRHYTGGLGDHGDDRRLCGDAGAGAGAGVGAGLQIEIIGTDTKPPIIHTPCFML